MLNAVSRSQNLDESPAAASSEVGEPSLLQLLQQEVQTLRRERDSLRQEKRSDKLEIERLKLLLDKLKRMLFGRKSEKLLRQIEQLELELEEAYINEGERQERSEGRAPKEVPPSQRERQSLPDHLPRDTKEHLPKDDQCPDCGGTWQRIGEDVSEVLEIVPARFQVLRHVRPRLACSCCDRMTQAAAPSRPIVRSYAGPGLLSHIMASKYLDHLPLQGEVNPDRTRSLLRGSPKRLARPR